MRGACCGWSGGGGVECLCEGSQELETEYTRGASVWLEFE